MAVKIKLKRLGKIREPYYRIVVADSRTKRDGRAIEEIGKYHPKAEPSLIEVNSERVQHWLSVGAQPTDPVRVLLKVTGDWQKFRGEPGSEGTLRTAAPREDKKEAFAAAAKASQASKEKDEKASAKGGPRAKPAAGGKARAASAKAEDGACRVGQDRGRACRVGQGRRRARRVGQGRDAAPAEEAPRRVGQDRGTRPPRRPRPRKRPPRRPRPRQRRLRRAPPRRPRPRKRPPRRPRPRTPPPRRPRLRKPPPRRPPRRPLTQGLRPDVLEEALEHLVRGIVQYPDEVRVRSRALRRGNVLEVRVNPDDLGKVIGRGGRTARALRTVIGALASGRYVRIDLLDANEVRLSGAGHRRPHRPPARDPRRGRGRGQDRRA